jgi:hypothetical protein
VYANLIRRFEAECCARIWRGEELNDAEWTAWSTLLEAHELNGHIWLGPMAGPDGSIDTVTGRCGLPPARVASWKR